MKKTVFTGIVVVLAAAVVAGFFMPWAKVSVSAAGVTKEASSAVSDTSFGKKFGKELGAVSDIIGEMGDIKADTSVTGHQIPVMVNSEESKLAISIAEILFDSVEDLDKKSYLVYVLPVSALICCAIALFLAGNKVCVFVLVAISGAIAGAGLYNVYTADLSSTAVDVVIGQGIWISLYSFMLMAFAGIVRLVGNKG